MDKGHSKSQIEQQCRDYLADRLPAADRKRLEERISNGDQLVISILNRLREFPDPTQRSAVRPAPPDDIDSNLSSYLPEEEKQQQTGQSKHRQKRSLQTESATSPNPFQEDRLKQSRKWGGNIVRLAGILAGILALIALYLMWQKISLEQQVSQLQQKNETQVQRYQKLQRQHSNLQKQFNQINALLQGENVVMATFKISPELSESVESAYFLFDESTLRAAASFNGSSLKRGEILNIWAQDNRNNWKWVGAVNQLRSDSIYTRSWINQSLERARELRLMMDSTSRSGFNGRRIPGKELGRFRVFP